ncbi:MAG: glycoside hydrolase family 9 protein [Polyangiaceae bacterium]
MLRPLTFLPCLVAVSCLAAPLAAQTFELRRVADDSVALSGTLSQAPSSGSSVPAHLADFSALTEPGEYYLALPASMKKSISFRVADDVYLGELRTLMLGFYGWRSGVDVAFEYRGQSYAHRAGHLEDALLDYVDAQVGVNKDGVGGWYDAGDYGKYLPTASESVGNMLLAWEQFPALQSLELPFLPEHGGELPDFLSELRWELDWMLKMAYDDGSGRVHHKINSPNFPGFVSPANDTSKRYFASYSSAATAEFAATLAKAARVFAPYDALTAGYSSTLLAAARTAYDYLVAHPESVRYEDTVLKAGGYQKAGDDDRLWAAAEMWETTGDELALSDVEARIGTNSAFIPNFDWDNQRNFGFVTYLRSQRPGKNPDIEQPLRARLDSVAQALVKNAAANAYGRNVSIYYWGSNGVIARTCVLLQTAYEFNPNPDYLDACARQVEFLYGRNQYNRSQVTGSGIEPPLHPHARISSSDMLPLPYPGLLVGGGQTDSDWVDTESNYTTNEIAINWNAALVYALAGFVPDGAAGGAERGPVTAADCEIRLSSVGFLPGRAKFATIVDGCGAPPTSTGEGGSGGEGAVPTGSPRGGGCGCRLGSSTLGDWGFLWPALALLGLMRRAGSSSRRGASSSATSEPGEP